MGVSTLYGLDPRSQGLKLQKLVELAASGVIKPHVGHTFAISDLPQAHHCQESGASLGKILVNNAQWS